MMLNLHKQIIIISFIYSFLVMFGVYGFGTDYYKAYIPDIDFNNILTYFKFNNDDLGWFLTTIHYKKIAIGLGFVSLLLAYSTGVLMLIESQLTKYKFPKYSYILFLHCWPILMFATNIIRQGLVTAMIYLSIVSYTYNFKKLSVSLIISTLFIHKIAFLFAPILLFSIIIIEANKILTINKVIFRVLNNSLILIAIISTIYIASSFDQEINSFAIGGDFTYIFLIINIFYISYYLIRGATLELIPIFLFYTSLVIIPIFFIGYSWEYERLNMSIIILYIIYLSKDLIFFKFRKYLIFTSVIFLVLISYYQGIFESLN